MSHKDVPLYEPTPEQIKKVCADIQAGWSEYERNKHITYGKRKPVELKPVKIEVSE